MEIESLIKKIDAAAAAVKTDHPRQIFYVPFASDEDPKLEGKTTVYEDAKVHRDVISVRVFVNEVEKAKQAHALEQQKEAKPSGENHSNAVSTVDDDDDFYEEEERRPLLEFTGVKDFEAHIDEHYEYDDQAFMAQIWRDFEKLPKEFQKQVMERVVQKTPVLLRHGDPMQKPRPNDVINVVAHGKADLDYIGTVSEVKGGKILKPHELVERMERDLGKEFNTIKLNSCGSGGEFVEAFHEYCSKEGQKHFPNALIRGYDKNVLNLYNKSTALWDREKGLRYVMSYEQRDAYKKARQNFETAQENLIKVKVKVDLENQRAKNINERLFPQKDDMDELNLEAEKTKVEFHEAKTVRDAALVKWKESAKVSFSPAKDNRQQAKVGEQFRRQPPSAGGGAIGV